jgi:hypothetical protein
MREWGVGMWVGGVQMKVEGVECKVCVFKMTFDRIGVPYTRQDKMEMSW